MRLPGVWIIVPAYNEARVIEPVLRALLELSPDQIVVVDDGSSDDTSKAAGVHPVVVLRHACNLGQGAALQTGLTYVLGAQKAEYIVTFDADGQHAPADVVRLIQALKNGYDVVLGSRFLATAGTIAMSPSRRFTLKLATAFTRLTTKLQITDTHNGLRAFTAQAASRLTITQNRMAHASEILAQIAAMKLRYCEVPVTVEYTAYSREKGQSALDSINIIWDILKGAMR